MELEGEKNTKFSSMMEKFLREKERIFLITNFRGYVGISSINT